MLSLDQVRLLEDRVEKAVNRIRLLSEENTRLKLDLQQKGLRVSELENLVRAFKDDQGRIEEGILNALEQLSAFEDTVIQTVIDAPVDTKNTIDTAAEDSSAQTMAEDESILSDIPDENQTGDLFDTPPTGQMDIF